MSKRSLIGALYAAAAALAVVIVGAAAVNLAADDLGSTPRAPITGASDAPTTPVRTLLVSPTRMPPPSQPGSALRALRVSGPVPSRASIGTVLSDRDCSPDRHGISHCLNRIRLADGSSVDVRHPHRMTEVPCLSPGERVLVRPQDA